MCRYKVRYYVNKGLALFNESLRVAGFTGLNCNDPTGTVRKVYPLPFIFAKDLGEQHTVAGVMQHHCATYVVPREAYADLRATRDPGYPKRTVKYMQDKRREIRKMPKKEATAEASRTGVYPRLKASAILCLFSKPSLRYLFHAVKMVTTRRRNRQSWMIAIHRRKFQNCRESLKLIS